MLKFAMVGVMTALAVLVVIGAGIVLMSGGKKDSVDMVNVASTARAGVVAGVGDAMPALSAEERRVIVDKGTERAFTGKYTDNKAVGNYVCRQCGAVLYRSADKFDSRCGWPSFDDEVTGAVRRTPDADGSRTEIVCAKCDGHLGHVFTGEQLTDKDTRHCVNSISLVFVPEPPVAAPRVETAIIAGGCFWGVENYFEKSIDGVTSAVSGYAGGTVANPTYDQVCRGNTDHAEAVLITFDPARVTYEQVLRSFFEIHDPTQLNRQGPDVGTQYRSAVFVLDEAQRATAARLIALLKSKGYDVKTTIEPLKSTAEFFRAEDYHQNYVERTGRGACHLPVKRFE